jgi:hypothetical protein
MAMSQWIEIVRAAGFDARQMEAIDAYVLAGRILRDPVVRKYRLAAREGVFIEEDGAKRIGGASEPRFKKRRNTLRRKHGNSPHIAGRLQRGAQEV